MSFVIGPDSLRLIPVAKAFKVARTQRAGNLKKHSFNRFHPIFSSEANYSNLTVGDLEQLVATQGIPCADKGGIETRIQIIPRIDGLDLFFKNGSGMKIANSISEKFVEDIFRSLDIMKVAVPWMRDMFDGLIDEVLLVENRSDDGRYVEFGFSHYSLFGCIMQSERASEHILIDHVVCTAHELSHNVLDICLAGAKPFAEHDLGTLVYSGVRKKHRPALLSLHAAMALSYMIVVVRGLLKLTHWNMSEKKYLGRLLVDYSRSLQEGLVAFRGIGFTRLGKMVYSDFNKVLTDAAV